MDSYTVTENTNSYTVTGLSDNDNYNVRVTAVGVCGMITSDPITVYGEFKYPVDMCMCVAMCMHAYVYIAYDIIDTYIQHMC